MKRSVLLCIFCLVFIGLYEQKNAGFNLEVIDSIPTEIDGGVCYFSENVHEYVNDKFLLVNDFAYYASIQIDGKHCCWNYRTTTRFSLDLGIFIKPMV